MTKFDCFKCLDKCNAFCCSIVPIEEEIYEANRDKIVTDPINEDIQVMMSPFTKKNETLIIALTKNGRCSFLKDDNSCAIEGNKPIVCRVYGDESCLMMTCAYQDKEGRIRSRQEQRKIEREQCKATKKVLKRRNKWNI